MSELSRPADPEEHLKRIWRALDEIERSSSEQRRKPAEVASAYPRLDYAVGAIMLSSMVLGGALFAAGMLFAKWIGH